MSEQTGFKDFGLDEKLLKAIEKIGYSQPTPIQIKAIPVVLEGKDVMGAAQTGTGKTASFGLPILQNLLRYENSSMSPARHPVRALILTPTRELALQVAENLEQYASETKLRVACVYGGVDIKSQAEELRKGVEVLIATPGRLLDHLEQRNTSLKNVEIVILDEADRMLDMGFLPDITKILKELPQRRQALMFSATFSPEIQKLGKSFLNEPIMIEVARQNTTASTITQELYEVENGKKTDALVEILMTKGVDDTGATLQAIIFVNSKLMAGRLSRQLARYGYLADAIHGDKSQEERTKTLTSFKDGTINYLVATDVAARGLDIPDMPLVINFDIPFAAEDYVHRIGRTGRAGSKGLAVSLMTAEDKDNVAAIERLTKKTFERIELSPKKIKFDFINPNKKYTYQKVKPDVDPFFLNPYVPSKAVAEKPITKTVGIVESAHENRSKLVAALLGGTGRRG